MIKRKEYWLGVLIFLFTILFVYWRLNEDNSLMGLRIVNDSFVEELKSQRAELSDSADYADSLLLDGASIPYDKNTNTFFLVQNVDNNSYEGRLSITNGYKAAVCFSNGTHDKQTVIKNAERFKILIYSEGEYAECKLLITGIPTVEMTSLTDLTIINPWDEEIKSLSIKRVNSLSSYNSDSETYSLRLFKNDYSEKKSMSFLNMGKYYKWKLYKISEKDDTFSRALIAYDIWNNISSNERLKRNCRAVYVIDDNSFKGVYILTPKLTNGYFGEANEDTVVDIADPGGIKFYSDMYNLKGEIDYDAISLQNAIDVANDASVVDFLLFLQTTYSISNFTYNDILVKHYDITYIMPDRVKNTLGIFPKELEYLSWWLPNLTWDYKNSGIAIGDESMNRYNLLGAEKWKLLRQSQLSDAELTELVDQYQKYMTKTGVGAFMLRNGSYGNYRYGDEESRANQAMKMAFDDLKSFVDERFRMLDDFYGG